MDEKPLTKRKKQAMETKNRIFETAMELFAKKGYKDIKIEDICRLADVSVGAFYHYFPSKNILQNKCANVSNISIFHTRSQPFLPFMHNTMKKQESA